jgi:diguanylate cyclase (GGDEF)-like protein
MDQPPQRLYARGATALIAGAVTVYTLVELSANLHELQAAWQTILLLFASTMFAARISSSSGGNAAPRGALIFILAGIALLPAPGGVVLAAGAALAGRGRGLAGPRGDGWPAIAALIFAVAVTEYLNASMALSASAASPLALLRIALEFLALQGFTLGLAIALGTGRPADTVEGPPDIMRRLLLEPLFVPLAWLLVMLVELQAWLPAAGLSAMVLGTLEALRRLSSAQQRLRQARESLSSRVAELALLHDVGRDLLGSLDPDQVYRVIDRESQKFLDVHACSVALADPDSRRLRRVYLRNEAGEQIGETSVASGLSARVLHQKRPLFVGDVKRLPRDGSLRANLLDPRSRSLMGVPLLVGKRVVGVLTVESLRPQAYDEHQLALLTTIGQQVAAAIESARYYHMARIDSLTGFLVKDHFFRRLDDEQRRARRYGGKFALLMIDLDSFKPVNDTHGHLAGDRFLREIAGTIRKQLRGNDLACRYGGDEFCLLLPESDLDAARATAERIRDAISQRIVVMEGAALRTTASIGVAVFPEHDEGSLRSLLEHADEALYRAKRGGRDRVESLTA